MFILFGMWNECCSSGRDLLLYLLLIQLSYNYQRMSLFIGVLQNWNNILPHVKITGGYCLLGYDAVSCDRNFADTTYCTVSSLGSESKSDNQQVDLCLLRVFLACSLIMKLEAELSSKFLVNYQTTWCNISVYNQALKRNSKFTWYYRRNSSSLYI